MTERTGPNLTAGMVGGVPFLILATVGLMVAKVGGYLDINWWVVFAPLWILWAIMAVLALLVGAGFLIYTLYGVLFKERVAARRREKTLAELRERLIQRRR